MIDHSTPIWKLYHPRQIATALVLGILGGTLVTTEKAAAYCMGEVVDLIDPVATVVVGPGDPVAEEALWSTFEHIQLIGPRELYVDNARADLEGGP